MGYASLRVAIPTVEEQQMYKRLHKYSSSRARRRNAMDQYRSPQLNNLLPYLNLLLNLYSTSYLT
jgi:hypothetical protein